MRLPVLIGARNMLNIPGTKDHRQGSYRALRKATKKQYYMCNYSYDAYWKSQSISINRISNDDLPHPEDAKRRKKKIQRGSTPCPTEDSMRLIYQSWE